MEKQIEALEIKARVLSSWLETPEVRPLLSAIPGISPLLTQLDNLNADFKRILAQGSVLSDDMKSLSLRAKRLNTVYFKKLKRIVEVLNAVLEVTGEPSSRDALKKMRGEIFPDSLVGKLDTYAHQASFVVLAEMKLSLKMKQLISGITYGDRCLFDDYSDWVAAGKALGAVEQERQRRLSEEGMRFISTAEVADVDERWVNLVQTLVGFLDDDVSVKDSLRKAVLTPLRDAETSPRRMTYWGDIKRDVDLDEDAAADMLLLIDDDDDDIPLDLVSASEGRSG